MDFKKINSLTKYPSILTYHELGERGRLTNGLSDSKGFSDSDDVFVYEKVDGENSRIILFKNNHNEIDYLIGSREELLYAKGDRIGNPYGNIAEFLKPLVERIIDDISLENDWALSVIYQESYGGKTKAAKNYTESKTQGYRVFDVFSLKQDEFDTLLELPLEKIAEWRDHGNQPFYDEVEKKRFVENMELEFAPLLDTVKGSEFPISLENTFSLLKKFESTIVGIDASGKSEGIIVRTSDRGRIRKIRFEDYERTFRK
ncbi:RNA ligase family protein [Paenibacillus sp. HWE-109]|uniref:RNA ligase family protein n=1 Tax=Paenibacillus sp. HWE-109 TaxID=1306526 RepID=UPI001EDE9577|nr:RNA ligase family protein [Paenibacillus sp. HWE-109]UKS30852.1 RNA ligase family protein [Paenibacillus sp. HWE-109]